MTHAMHTILALLVFSIACGGSPKETATAPDTTTPQAGDNSGSGGSVNQSGSMISPDKMEEAQRALDRKSMIMSQCVATAVGNRELKGGSHGKVALEIVITGTRASSVKVIKSDFSAQSVSDCVVKH